jgi:hypothetical protein
MERSETGSNAMNASEMIELSCRRPFVPFTIRLRDGSTVHVDQPNIVATGKNSPECVVYESVDRIRFMAYRDITEVITTPVNGAQQEKP